MKKQSILILLLLSMVFVSCMGQSVKNEVYPIGLKPKNHQAMAAFASGCFWCTEHIFDQIQGVDSVIVGYSGGHTSNPSYEQVCTETTGHAESYMVYYNPKILSYHQLLDIFFLSQNPTTYHQQGPDKGSSYRSIIFYQNQLQKEEAVKTIDKFNKSGKWKNPILTELLALKVFYRAEDFHQNYVKRNPFNPYVRGVSKPRYENFKNSISSELLKK